MTALHRVKAYFGMVPADELDSYDGYGEYGAYGAYPDVDRPARGSDRYDADRYDADRHDSDRYARRPRHDRYDIDRYDAERGERYAGDRHGADRFGEGRHDDDRYEDRYDAARHDRFDADRHERTGRGETARGEERARTPRPRDPEPEVRADLPRLGADHDRTGSGDRDEEADVSVRSSARGRSWEHNTGPNHASRSGRSGALASVGSSSGSSSSLPGSLSASGAAALALDDEPARRPSERPERSERSDVAAVADTPAVPEITTLQPTSYNEARVIGERYRDGIPVIMNLTEMDDVAAKRLVDFAAGLAFALRGSIEKVTNRVFLLSPPNVEVSATDRRKLAEKSFSTAT